MPHLFEETQWGCRMLLVASIRNCISASFCRVPVEAARLSTNPACSIPTRRTTDDGSAYRSDIEFFAFSLVSRYRARIALIRSGKVKNPTADGRRELDLTADKRKGMCCTLAGIPNFQGYGVVQTDDEGRHRFLTVKPGEYPGRTPHLHFKIGGPGFERLTTQMYFADEPGNERDFVRKQIGDPEARASVTVAFAPSAETGVASDQFDIVLGQ